MPRVAVTRTLPPPAVARLRRAGHDVRQHDHDEPPDRDALLHLVAGADAVITLLSDRVDDAFLDAAGPDLRIVANYAVGLNNVDLDACRARGVAVAHTPGVLTEETADMTWALLLAVARRVIEGHRLAASGRWTGWAPMQLLGTSLHGATFGVVGLGRIGAAAARRARGFGMEVVHASPSPKPEAERDLPARRVELDDLLTTADVVSLHCPSTPETRHLLDAEALARLKPSAIVVNTARGDVIDEQALVDALDAGRVAGAGLDVFEREPRIHPRLRWFPNVVRAPQLGAARVGAGVGLAHVVADAVVRVLDGRDAPNLA
ncbi:MAG: D-glycerate dehydrogenase [Trueperaceae bacterium]